MENVERILRNKLILRFEMSFINNNIYTLCMVYVYVGCGGDNVNSLVSSMLLFRTLTHLHIPTQSHAFAI